MDRLQHNENTCINNKYVFCFKSHNSAAGCWNIKQAKSTHVLILNVFEGEYLMSLMFRVHLKMIIKREFRPTHLVVTHPPYK